MTVYGLPLFLEVKGENSDTILNKTGFLAGVTAFLETFRALTSLFCLKHLFFTSLDCGSYNTLVQYSIPCCCNLQFQLSQPRN